jgi:oligoribonuclease NrnB/cAMP/cGMP phosphodiesterase (DHH superfamily)
MDDALIDDEGLGMVRRSLLPGEGFFVPDSVEEDVEDEEAREALDGAEVAVVADTDADGLGCVALVREAFGDAAALPAGPHDVEEALERVAAFAEPGVDLFVCDLCPDSYEYVGEELEAAVAVADSVRWFDHHQWDPEVAAAVRAAGVDLVVGESEEECTADVALRELDHEFPERFVELAAVTRDHDLWIKEDPRSDDLADYARWAEDDDEYVATVREHGPDLPPEVQELLAERRERKDALVKLAVERGEYEDVGPWTVGVTYGRCSQNEVAEAMRTRGADAAVVVKPSGPASIRGSEGFERAHEVAALVNGGGHPRAAGCKPDVYDDMLDYAHHWTTQGAVTKQTILDAFERVAAEEADADGDGGSGPD